MPVTAQWIFIFDFNQFCNGVTTVTDNLGWLTTSGGGETIANNQ